MRVKFIRPVFKIRFSAYCYIMVRGTVQLFVLFSHLRSLLQKILIVLKCMPMLNEYSKRINDISYTKIVRLNMWSFIFKFSWITKFKHWKSAYLKCVIVFFHTDFFWSIIMFLNIESMVFICIEFLTFTLCLHISIVPPGFWN